MIQSDSTGASIGPVLYAVDYNAVKVHAGSTPASRTYKSWYTYNVKPRKTDCTKCNTKLSKLNRASGRNICKECDAKRMRYYFQANPDKYNKHKGYVAKNDKEWTIRVRSLLFEYLKNGCQDCGEADIVVLDFDHREPGKKNFTVSQVIRTKKTIEDVIKEIEACDVVCSNCHRRRTAKQFGNWRLDIQIPSGRLERGLNND